MSLRLAQVPGQHPRSPAEVSAEPASSLRVLLERLVDYAGLFPPAALPMPAAVAAFGDYRASADAWALGRFVVPIARLSELVDATAPHEEPDAPWELTVLGGDDVSSDATMLDAFARAHPRRFTIDAIEVRAPTAERVRAAAAAFAPHMVYAEVPVSPLPSDTLEEVKRAGLRAKVRMGGITADAFPSGPHVATFIARCAALELPFKATAGLHHPVCGVHPLTYAADAPHGPMFGFVNLFLASAIAWDGGDEAIIAGILADRDPAAFTFADAAATWRDQSVSTERLREARQSFAISFGSCSFREPIDDLHALGLL